MPVTFIPYKFTDMLPYQSSRLLLTFQPIPLNLFCVFIPRYKLIKFIKQFDLSSQKILSSVYRIHIPEKMSCIHENTEGDIYLFIGKLKEEDILI